MTNHLQNSLVAWKAAVLLMFCATYVGAQNLPAGLGDPEGIVCPTDAKCVVMQENNAYILTRHGMQWDGTKRTLADGWETFDFDQADRLYIGGNNLVLVDKDDHITKLLGERVLSVRAMADGSLFVITPSKLLGVTASSKKVWAGNMPFKVVSGTSARSAAVAATMREDGRITIWKAKDGHFVQTCVLKGRPAETLEMSENWLAYRVNHNLLQLVDVNKCASFDVVIDSGDLEEVAVDSEHIAVGMQDGDVFLIDPTTRSRVLLKNVGRFPYLSFAPGSKKLIAVTSEDIQILQVAQ